MSLKEIDVRRAVTEWVQGKHRGYMAAGALALVAGVITISRLGIQADPGVAEPAEEAQADAPSDPAAANPAADSTVFTKGGEESVLVAADASTRVARPQAIRGLYLNAWATGSTKKLDKLIGIANSTEINAFVIDVKEAGEISYQSTVPLVNEIDADRQYVRDIRAVLAKMKANNIYPIARIVAFKDPVLAKARPDLAIQKHDGSLWVDNHGNYWVDSFNKEVWDYNIAIAREAIQLGFSEVQWDYVRFPDVPQSLMRTAVWPARAGREKEDGIREFLLYSRQQLADLNVPITADVFGLAVSAHDDVGIGQKWDKLVDAADALLPMVYPSHYARGSYGIPVPNAAPYETVKTAMEYARKRTDGKPNAARIIPWLQDFTLGQPRYGPSHVRAQIDAVYDAGLQEWVLWHPGSNYTVSALAGADGTAPTLAPVQKTSDPAKPQAPAAKPADDGLLGTPVKVDTLKSN